MQPIEPGNARKKLKLSVVVPCYRDELNIRELYRRLKSTLEKVADDHEIIYINDSSPDNSREVLDELAKTDSKLRVVHHSRNFGLMSVYTMGMRMSTGDAVVLMDGDLQDPPELIESFVEHWRKGYLVVYGVHKEREEIWLKRVLFMMFYRVWRYLTEFEIPLDSGDFSLMDRKVVDILNALPERDRFIRGLRAWVGFPQIGVPFKRAARYKGTTTQSFFSYCSWAIFAITSFSTTPLRFVTIFATTMIFVSLTYLAVLCGMFFMNIRGPQGFMTLIGVILLVASSLFACLAIIAEYLLRIYKEIKNRPSSIAS